MQYSNTYVPRTRFDHTYHNSDGTNTTIITTCVCEQCGVVSIHMEQTPVALAHGKHLQSHDALCNQCEWANSAEYI